MIINNFEQIKSLLSFESSDCFYHLQLLIRKKDNPEAKNGNCNNARCIKTYYIKSIEHLESKQEEIIKMCELFTARAYINLNCKSFKKASLQLLKEVANRIMFEQEEYLYRAFESVAGELSVNCGEKRWIVDIDTKVMNHIEWDTLMGTINYVCDPIIPTIGGESKIIAIIPTKSGYHLITKPFNVSKFKEIYSEIDIQKNNPTLLYFNSTENGKSN